MRPGHRHIAALSALPVVIWAAWSWAGLSEAVVLRARATARELGAVRAARAIDSAATIQWRVVRMAEQDWVLEARSAALAVVNATRHFEDLAYDQGVMVESVQQLSTRSSANGRLRIKGAVSGTFNQVAAFLAAVEEGPPRAAIRETVIALSTSRTGGKPTLVKAQIVADLRMVVAKQSTRPAAP